MSKTVNVSFKLDSSLKQQMKAICKDQGISMRAAFISFAKKVCSENKIPFEFSLDPFYSKENMERLRKSIAQMESSVKTITLKAKQSTLNEIGRASCRQRV